ncbi:MAG: D-2-hydroxyacid dehydrogenase [Deltaproteobacteria bacterium]|jgi:glycerate dehydrogenase|nr:D-2-hydroxyacid dehydrogenase [Deltaproteobacteria bacterium]
MPKLVVLDAHTLNPGDISWDPVKSVAEDFTSYERTANEDRLERIGDADLVLTNKTPLSRDIIEKAPNVRYIGVLATGYNIVDLGAASEKNIVVTNIPGYATDAVAQLTFALLLEVCWHVGHHSRVLKAGRYKTLPDFCFWDFPLSELTGKVMGIVGYGAIGKAVAKIARAMGMEVIAHNGERPPKNLGGETAPTVSFAELLRRSDVISLHAPLNEKTAGMINRASIAGMKDGVVIINTARGGLIEEKDLADALMSGKVAHAAVDVVSREPIRDDNPLLSVPNCLITPHFAWGPTEVRRRLMETAAENIRRFLAGNPQNTVTFEKS